jgi:hypothetical protein
MTSSNMKDCPQSNWELPDAYPGKHWKCGSHDASHEKAHRWRDEEASRIGEKDLIVYENMHFSSTACMYACLA